MGIDTSAYIYTINLISGIVNASCLFCALVDFIRTMGNLDK